MLLGCLVLTSRSTSRTAEPSASEHVTSQDFQSHWQSQHGHLLFSHFPYCSIADRPPRNSFFDRILAGKMSMTLLLQPAHGYILLNGVFTAFIATWAAAGVGKARKLYDVQYPTVSKWKDSDEVSLLSSSHFGLFSPPADSPFAFRPRCTQMPPTRTTKPSTAIREHTRMSWRTSLHSTFCY